MNKQIISKICYYDSIYSGYDSDDSDFPVVLNNDILLAIRDHLKGTDLSNFEIAIGLKTMDCKTEEVGLCYQKVFTSKFAKSIVYNNLGYWPKFGDFLAYIHHFGLLNVELFRSYSFVLGGDTMHVYDNNIISMGIKAYVVKSKKGFIINIESVSVFILEYLSDEFKFYPKLSDVRIEDELCVVFQLDFWVGNVDYEIIQPCNSLCGYDDNYHDHRSLNSNIKYIYTNPQRSCSDDRAMIFSLDNTFDNPAVGGLTKEDSFEQKADLLEQVICQLRMDKEILLDQLQELSSNKDYRLILDQWQTAIDLSYSKSVYFLRSKFHSGFICKFDPMITERVKVDLLFENDTLNMLMVIQSNLENKLSEEISEPKKLIIRRDLVDVKNRIRESITKKDKVYSVFYKKGLIPATEYLINKFMNINIPDNTVCTYFGQSIFAVNNDPILSADLCSRNPAEGEKFLYNKGRIIDSNGAILSNAKKCLWIAKLDWDFDFIDSYYNLKNEITKIENMIIKKENDKFEISKPDHSTIVMKDRRNNKPEDIKTVQRKIHLHRNSTVSSLRASISDSLNQGPLSPMSQTVVGANNLRREKLRLKRESALESKEDFEKIEKTRVLNKVSTIVLDEKGVPIPPPLPNRSLLLGIKQNTEAASRIDNEIATNQAIDNTPLKLEDTASKEWPKQMEKISWADEVEEDVEREMEKLGLKQQYDQEIKRVGVTKTDNKQEDENSDSEDSMELESDEDDTDFCCVMPREMDVTNIKAFTHYYGNFIGGYPQYNCLTEGLKLSLKIIELIAKSENLPMDVGCTVKSLLKFRHDYFSYYFINEIIGIKNAFGTDVQIPFIDYEKTPDFLIVNESLKKIEIIEFTVVENMLRANFLKGLDNKSSIYRNEIKFLEMKGYEVVYKPVALALGSTIEQNTDVWKTNRFEMADYQMEHLDMIKNLMRTEHKYIFSFSFHAKYLERHDGRVELVLEEEKLQRWDYYDVQVQKVRFNDIRGKLMNYQFDEGFGYEVFFKGRKSIIRQLDINSGRFSYDNMIKMKKDSVFCYNMLKSELKGKEHIYIRGKDVVDSKIVVKHNHGEEMLLTNNMYTSLFEKNDRYNDKYTFEDIDSVFDDLKKVKKSGLTKPITEESIKQGLLRFNKRMEFYSTERIYVNPAFFNDPRRSFSNLFNLSRSSDQKYGKPVNLQFSVFELKSKVAQFLLSNIKDECYDITRKQDISSIIEYKEKLSKVHNFLINKGLNLNDSFKKNQIMLSELPRAEFKLLINDLRSSQKRVSKEKTLNQNGLHKLTRPMSVMLKKEMNWKKQRGYKLYMDDSPDISLLKSDLSKHTDPINFTMKLPEPLDVKILSELKSLANKKLNDMVSEIKTLKLFHCLVFHSRLCYTLLAASSRTFNAKNVLIDNLGFNNVALLVKGGKKISNTRTSKIFKLIYPALSDAMTWQPTSYAFGEDIIDETSWMQMPQDHIMDGLALPYKFLMNYTYLREKYDKGTTFDILFTPTMLALHNRRNTEKTLHNMRYLVVNCISRFAQVDKIMDDFEPKSYTAFEKNIYKTLSLNYLDYFKTIRKWAELGSNIEETFQSVIVKHPYQDRRILNIDDLTYVIYSTYMMSKGGYQQSVEQTMNLESIMKTHKYYKNEVDSIIINNHVEEEIYENDFKYSPKLSYAVGKILASEIKKHHGVTDLNVKYRNLLADPVDWMANNRGLRYKDEMFFGHKGYFVIYKELFKNNLDEILELVNNKDLSLKKLNMKLREMNKTFETEQGSNKLDKVVFHVVDKVQRGGGREIYVMDYITKLYQHPIEKMFKRICEYIDNEIITVPSGQRASLIHKKNFEYSNDKYTTYYLTLDCRKWAPRSSPDKYLHMLEGMRGSIPSDFIDACYAYFGKHSEKLIKTRRNIFDQLNKKTNGDYSLYFDHDDVEKSSFFQMPYSFVMGIFNMLSSLMHAGLQLLAKTEIENFSAIYGVNIQLNLVAHSDDSAGSLAIESNDEKVCDKILVRSVTLYEAMQKCVNHMMSEKKCNISLNYFELLSILYLQNELLTVLPKFLGGFSAVFSGKGVSNDMKQVVSKSIELLSNGASNSLAYQCQIIMSNFYMSFYRIKIDTQIPALGGSASSWPTMYLGFGSYADEVRSSLFNPLFYKRYVNFAEDCLDFEIYDGTINLKFANQVKLPQAYQNFDKSFQLPMFEDNEWFFGQNKTRHSLLNLFWFKAQLSKPDFAVSLLNINEVRRALDSMYMASGDKILGKYKNFNINDIVLTIIDYKPKESSYFSYMKVVFKELFDFYEDLQGVEQYKIAEKTRYAHKPCTLTMQQFTESPITEFNPLNLAVQLCRPELCKYMYTNHIFGNELETMRRFLTNLGIPNDLKTVKTFLDYLTKFRSFTANFYLSAPHNSRIFLGREGLVDLICINHSATQKVELNKNFLVKSSKYKFDLTQNMVDRISISYLYAMYKSSKNIEMGAVTVNLFGKRFMINSIPYLGNEELPSNVASFLDLIDNEEGKIINLLNCNCWAFWIDRQAKVSGTWVGGGKMVCSLSGKVFELYIKNDKLIKITTSTPGEIILNTVESAYFDKLMADNKINYLSYITPGISPYYFGVNSLGVMGMHPAITVVMGVPVHTDPYIDYESLQSSVHKFDYGHHVIKFRGLLYKLQTIDSLYFNLNRKQILKLIDWKNVQTADQSKMLSVLFSGKYGNFENVKYNVEEIIENPLKTEIYSLVYNKVIRDKNKLNAVFWDDAVTSMINQKEVLPIMFESVGASDMIKILPESKKDYINLFKFYEVDNDKIFNLNTILKTFSTEEDAASYYSHLLMDIKDSTGMSRLPEIGDPTFFNNFIYNSENRLPIQYWVSCGEVFSEALYNGYQALQNKQKYNISEFYKSDITLETIKYIIFQSCSVEYRQSENYSCLTVGSMVCHMLIDEIMNFQHSFAEFAKTFRRTSLSRMPRHPRYTPEIQVTLANIFKYMFCHNFTDEEMNLIPASVRRQFLSEDKRLKNANLQSVPESIPKGSFACNIKYKFDIDTDSFYSLSMYNLLSFNSSASLPIDTSCAEEYFDEEKEETFHKIRHQEYRSGLVMFRPNAKSVQFEKYLITDIYDPICRYEGIVNKKRMFAYNINPDIANDLGFMLKNHNREKKMFKKYINFYNMSWGNIVLDEIDHDLSLDPNINFEDFEVKLENRDMLNPSSYDYKLVDWLVDTYKIKDEYAISDLKNIVDAKLTPITKLKMLRSVVGASQTTKTDNLSEMIRMEFQKFNQNFNIEEKDETRIEILSAGKEKQNILKRCTNLRVELEQLDIFIKGLASDLVLSNIIIRDIEKRSLLSSIETLINLLKYKKDKKKIALLRILKAAVESVEVGVKNTEGIRFDEIVRGYLVDMSPQSDGEEDIEEIDKPEFYNGTWSLEIKI